VIPTITALNDFEKIGIIGDVHGRIEDLFGALEVFTDWDAHLLVQLGDFGWPWPGRAWAADLDRISTELTRRGQYLLFVDGNHDWIPEISGFPIAEDGVRWLRSRVGHLPRGSRGFLADGTRTFAALGGANSIDRQYRPAGTSWWPEESITVADLAVLGHDPVDVLFSHDAPDGLLKLDAMLGRTAQYWSATGLEYAAEGRRMFSDGFTQVAPHLALAGHYHHFVDEYAGFYDRQLDRSFATRVVVLNKLSDASTPSLALLDSATLELELLKSSGDYVDAIFPIRELTIAETGVYMVHTLNSQYRLNLNERLTVERIPGPNAHPTINDGLRLLRTLDQCRIGGPGRWTMHAGDDLSDFTWQRTSTIRHIVCLDP
jgi:hypothetical protein